MLDQDRLDDAESMALDYCDAVIETLNSLQPADRSAFGKAFEHFCWLQGWFLWAVTEDLWTATNDSGIYREGTLIRLKASGAVRWADLTERAYDLRASAAGPPPHEVWQPLEDEAATCENHGIAELFYAADHRAFRTCAPDFDADLVAFVEDYRHELRHVGEFEPSIP